MSELNTSARDVLAQAGDLPGAAREWVRIEELGGHLEVAEALTFIESMVGLGVSRGDRRCDGLAGDVRAGSVFGRVGCGEDVAAR